jgi:plastocyanin
VTRAFGTALTALLLGGFALAGPASAERTIAPAGIKVTILNHTFVPRVVHARSGQPIVFTNEDQDPHTVTSGPHNIDDGKWKTSPLIPDGASFVLHLVRPGTYPYFCNPHQYQDSMHGSIVVSP